MQYCLRYVFKASFHIPENAKVASQDFGCTCKLVTDLCCAVLKKQHVKREGKHRLHYRQSVVTVMTDAALNTLAMQQRPTNINIDEAELCHGCRLDLIHT